MKMKYILEIEPGDQPKTWQWQIVSPQGHPHAWGASAKTKADLTADLKKALKRLNEHCASFNGADIQAKRKHQARMKLLKSPRNTTTWTKEEDQIVIDHYPDEGWKGVFERMNGKYKKSIIYARAHSLGVRAKRTAKQNRWVA